jgi:hypothetical protein
MRRQTAILLLAAFLIVAFAATLLTRNDTSQDNGQPSPHALDQTQ